MLLLLLQLLTLFSLLMMMMLLMLLLLEKRRVRCQRYRATGSTMRHHNVPSEPKRAR
jgi:hypothetical protein